MSRDFRVSDKIIDNFSRLVDINSIHLGFYFYVMGRKDILPCDQVAKAAEVFLEKFIHLDNYKDLHKDRIREQFYTTQRNFIQKGEIYINQCAREEDQ